MTSTINDARDFVDGVTPHIESMLRLAHRLAGHDAEDIVQDALGRAWAKRRQYNPARGSLRSWLLAITADRAYKAWRWNKRHVGLLAEAAEQASPDKYVDLESCLARLPARQRLAVNCFYFADLSVAETATVMRCSEGTVKSTLAAARSKLRELMR
jgi:RNA polymerase sigma factor (sigma-70 family)